MKRTENKKLKFLIITPACNEEKFLQKTIDSVVNQSHVPVEWIIVDDGSTDETGQIIKNASISYNWISHVQKIKKDIRSPGSSVISAFYYGYERKKNQDFDVIMKLDADIILPVDYIQKIAKNIQSNDKIGICGGVCVTNGIQERITNLDHVRGAIKSYRKKCFSEIGGLLKEMGWDTVDEHTARYFGWEVLVFKNLKVEHQRKTNLKFGYIRAGYINGRMLYSIRMDFMLMLSNMIKWSFRFPYILPGLFLFFGYIKSFFLSDKKIVSKELGVFIRKYRYKKIKEKFTF